MTRIYLNFAGVAEDMFWNGASSSFTWQQFDPLAGVLNAVTYKVTGAFSLSASHTAPFAIAPIVTVSKGFTLNGTGLLFKPWGSAPFDGMLNATWNGFGVLPPGVTQTQTRALEFLRVPDFASRRSSVAAGSPPPSASARIPTCATAMICPARRTC
jgi:hypothetical protein